MATRIGINGFGRIGRQVLKAILEQQKGTFDVVAINDLFPTETNAHLFKYDSNYGIFDGTVEIIENNLVINGDTITVFSERDPGRLPWGDLGVDIVIESTGVFRDTNKVPGPQTHIEQGGAKKVIISAPAKGEDLTIVLGVNDDLYDPAIHHILSNASCTTNCLAPPAKVVNDNWRIVKGLMTTIHSYTNDQQILDLAHKDMRRARAAAVNLIPTTTGAAKAIALVIPELKGKMDGYSIRVPTPTVSLVDCVVQVEKATSVDELNAAFKTASEGRMKGIFGYSDEPLVSMDYKGDPRSLVKFVSWYDNEWGYSCRTVDLAVMISQSL